MWTLCLLNTAIVTVAVAISQQNSTSVLTSGAIAGVLSVLANKVIVMSAWHNATERFKETDEKIAAEKDKNDKLEKKIGEWERIGDQGIRDGTTIIVQPGMAAIFPDESGLHRLEIRLSVRCVSPSPVSFEGLWLRQIGYIHDGVETLLPRAPNFSVGAANGSIFEFSGSVIINIPSSIRSTMTIVPSGVTVKVRLQDGDAFDVPVVLPAFIARFV
jgi:hypothetical protein